MEEYKKTIAKLTQLYLSRAVPGWSRNGHTNQFSCPKCNNLACKTNPRLDFIMRCSSCNWEGTIIDAVRMLESNRTTETEDEIYRYLAEKLGVDIVTDNEIDMIFKMYQRLNFDMVQVRSRGKAAFEIDWQKTSYKNPDDWKVWLKDQMNIGVKTGKISQITVVDIDCKNIDKGLPDEYKPYLENIDTLIQETENGYHYFFDYEPDLPKTAFDIVLEKKDNPKNTKKFHIDIENDGGQVVVFPSIVKDEDTGKIGFRRRFNVDQTKLHSVKLAKMPEGLKKLFLNKSNKSPVVTTSIGDLSPELLSGCENFLKIESGNRNNALIHLGGIFRKELNTTQTENVLRLVNRTFVSPPLDDRELKEKIFNPLRKYVKVDENELAKKVLDYMMIVGEATAADIRAALNYNKYDTDKATELLVREGFLFKKRRSYHLIKKAIWSDQWGSEGEPIKFEMPYFDSRVNFRDGDMIIIGAKTGVGKTHVAMNIIKKLVDQGKKPYYISLESGSRFVSIAKSLQMAQGDFFHTTLFAPEDVELEKDAITIIDWLLPEDYSQTDKLYKYFAEQLTKQGGILIVFVQLKEYGDSESRFFAENMIKMFPALVAKFAYKKDDKGNDTPEKSTLESVKIRDPKTSGHKFIINLKYDFSSKTLEEEI